MLLFKCSALTASGRLRAIHSQRCGAVLVAMTAFVVVPVTIAQQTVLAASNRPPNIVLIMSDDMGFSDLGCYGGEIDTPTLNRLADGGLRFTQFYNTGRCCPTRASLLTGLYPHQAGVGWMMTDGGYDGYRGELNRQCVTIAEVLKPAGYSTYGVGKWHVTKHIQPDGPKDNWPLQRGFDRFYGTITGAGSFYDPSTLTRDNTMISPFADSEYQPEQYYYTNAISDHAVRFINEHCQQQAQSKPFFMYVAYTAAHWPMHALERDIAKYRGKYDEGYAPIRAARFERAKRLGLIDPNWDLSPQTGDWNRVENQAWESRCMEVYAAMIDCMDQGIGRIAASLESNGQLENTLILFLQDNGGCQEANGRNGDWQRPVDPSLPKIAADAIRLDVVPKQNRAGVPTLTGPGIMPGPEDTYIAYGINWANVSNTPFREYKHFVHEGGISTPLIAHWPAGIKRRGELESQPGHLIDVMATCVELAGAKYPATFHGDEKIKPMEGRSLAPAFNERDIERDAIYWEHEGNRAIRVGRWKLVAKENKPWELYDMQADRTEMRDLSKEQPDRVDELSAKWDAWAERADVLPLGGWRSKTAQQSFNKRQRRFELKAGDDLSREEAPFVEGRPFTIVAEVLESADNGVIVAQGGEADGYALYMKNGMLTYACRHQGKRLFLTAEKPLPASSCTVTLTVAKDGKVHLEADECPLLDADTPGPLIRMPIDGLQVGRDNKGPVGDYSSPFAFPGKLGKVTVVVGK